METGPDYAISKKIGFFGHFSILYDFLMLKD